MREAIHLCEEDECNVLEAFLVERIYEFNAEATGHHDGRLLGAYMRDDSGRVVGALNGHTWGGCCVVAHLWVHASRRGRGIGTALLRAAETEARRRGCRQVVLSTHSFQAPGFYERHGYTARATVRDWPAGHAGVVYARPLA